MEDLDLAIKYEPTAFHHFVRASVYAEFGKNEEAVAGTMSLYSRYETLKLTLSLAAKRIDFAEALGREEESSLNQEFIIRCRYRRALSYFELKMYHEVILDAQGVLALDATSVNARLLMGRALKLINEYQKAENQLTEAILLDDNQAELYTGEGVCRFCFLLCTKSMIMLCRER